MNRLKASDYRFIAICLAIFAAATWFSTGNFHRAFPEASIDFRVSRDDGRVIAQRFLETAQYRTAGYRQASSFTYDDDAKTFLERTLGLEQANRLMGTRVRLWRWSYRWFRPQQKEEFRIDITPAGDFAGFSHEIAEEDARPAVSAERSRALAEEYLHAIFHRDPAQLDFVEASEVARPHRTDRTFTWKERDFNLRDAENRVEIGMLGDEPGSYREYLKVPDQWSRDYQRLRSKNGLAQTIDTAVMAVLVLGLVVVIVMRIRKGDVRWRGAALVGSIGVLLSLCSNLNEFPLREFAYPTTDSYASFLSRQALEAVLGALAAGGLLFTLAAGAEPMYREAYGGQVALGNLFGARGLRTRRFLLGSILGITLTAVFIAYQTGFYMAAYRFGAWSPADVPYSDLLNTKFPWAFVLFGGFLPAVSEEFLFRMFAIPFLRKLVRWLPGAVVLAGFIWGFGHSGYPQQPFFIRGLEVGIGGVALGIVMLRWGILPTLVWHYSVDAMYSAMLLLRSHSWYLKLSGAASAGLIVLPVAVALIGYWRRGGFEPHEGLLNADEDRPAEPPVESVPAPLEASVGYVPLSRAMRWAAAGALAIGLAMLMIPVKRFGEEPRYKIGSVQARASADQFVRSLGLQPGSFRQVTYPSTRWDGNDELAGKYFLEHRSLAVSSGMFEHNRTLQRWVTRYFRSLDKEEVLVSVHPETGRVQGFVHTIAEDAPGADVPEGRAIAIANTFAAANGWNVAGMELKESNSEKKKARRDYTLVWEAPKGDPRNVEEAHFRVEATVSGDRVTSLGSTWKLPENWERSRTSRNLLWIAVLTIRIGVFALLIVRGIWMTIGNIRQGLVPWGTVVRLAAPAALLGLLAAALSLPMTLQNYPTSIPLETFQVTSYIGVAIAAVFGFLAVGGAGALLTSFFPDCLAAMRSGIRRILAVDALAALAAAVGLGLALARLHALLETRFPALALPSIGTPELLGSSAPAVSALAGAWSTILVRGAALGVFVLVLRMLPRKWMRVTAGLATACAILPMDVHSAGEFALHYADACLVVGCTSVFCLFMARSNYLAYLLVLTAMTLAPAISELIGEGNASLSAQGWSVVAVLAAGIVWATAPGLRKKAAALGAAAQ